jgi:general secretion pathway protein K
MMHPFRHRERRRGFIVIAVLWILAALSALVLIYLTFVTNTAVVVAGSTDRVQDRGAGPGGRRTGRFQLDRPQRGGAADQRNFQRPGRRRAGVRDLSFRGGAHRPQRGAEEPARRSHDRARRSRPSAAVYADRILAWRAPTEAARDDPENSFYRTSGLPTCRGMRRFRP